MVKVFRNGKHNKMNLEFEGREKEERITYIYMYMCSPFYFHLLRVIDQENYYGPTHKSSPLIRTAKRLPFDTRFRLAARQPTSKRPPEGGSRVSSTPLPGPRQRFVERGVSPPSRLHSPTARSLSLEVPSFIAGPCERKSRSRLASSSSSFSSANPR